MKRIEARYEAGDRFALRIRQHYLFVDQPIPDGGDDYGPAPIELFVGALAACVGFYAERFLRRHSLSTDGLHVECDFEMGERPARVVAIDLGVVAPGLTEETREAFTRVIEHCTASNTLRVPPEIRIDVGVKATLSAP